MSHCARVVTEFRHDYVISWHGTCDCLCSCRKVGYGLMANSVVTGTRNAAESVVLRRDRLDVRAAGFRSILCAVDFSLHSKRALQCAATIAARGNGTLVVTYVNDPLLVTAAALVFHDRQAGKRTQTELDAFVASTLSADCRRRLNVKTDVNSGNVVKQILAFQRRYASDLIVVGTHGWTGADRIILGSTTLGLLRRTRVPVLAVPKTKNGRRLSTRWPGDRMVAAIELDRRSAREALTAARIARWLGTSLMLVHVADGMNVPAWLGGDLTRDRLIRIRAEQKKLNVIAARARSIVDTEARLLYGRTADELTAVVAAEPAQLLITAIRDRRRWSGGARGGSVSYHVLSHAVTPVLACPPHWRFR